MQHSANSMLRKQKVKDSRRVNHVAGAFELPHLNRRQLSCPGFDQFRASQSTGKVYFTITSPFIPTLSWSVHTYRYVPGTVNVCE